MSYSADEMIGGYPIAAVDGATFGSLYDGSKTSICGTLVDIAGVVHIIVDRIWENDGTGGFVYDDKYNADHKISPVRPGYPQYDTAMFTYNARGGNVDLTVTPASGSAPKPNVPAPNAPAPAPAQPAPAQPAPAQPAPAQPAPAAPDLHIHFPPGLDVGGLAGLGIPGLEFPHFQMPDM